MARLFAVLTLVAAYCLTGANPAAALSTPSIASVQSGNTTVGLQVFDAAILSGGSNPTGALTFNLFGPGNATCNGTPIFTSTVTVAGDATYDSAHFTTTQAGTYHWVVSYSGDAANNPAGPTSCSDSNETVIVGKFPTGLATTASPGVAVGAPVHDTATIRGLNPTGTISFLLSGPTTTFCSPLVFTAHVSVNEGSGSYPSPSFTPTVPGTYRWQALYSGDLNNAATPISSCLTEGESVVVTAAMATPSISTTASQPVVVGGTVTDTATLAAGNTPTGSIIFNLFGPGNAACTGAPAFTSVTGVNAGNGAYPSGPFTVAAVGVYRWTASYSGDTGNKPVTSGCGAANESVTVAKANTTIATHASGPVTVGATIGDTAILTGGFSPTGTITFDLFGPDNSNCTGTPATSFDQGGQWCRQLCIGPRHDQVARHLPLGSELQRRRQQQPGGADRMPRPGRGRHRDFGRHHDDVQRHDRATHDVDHGAADHDHPEYDPPRYDLHQHHRGAHDHHLHQHHRGAHDHHLDQHHQHHHSVDDHHQHHRGAHDHHLDQHHHRVDDHHQHHREPDDHDHRFDDDIDDDHRSPDHHHLHHDDVAATDHDDQQYHRGRRPLSARQPLDRSGRRHDSGQRGWVPRR